MIKKISVMLLSMSFGAPVVLGAPPVVPPTNDLNVLLQTTNNIIVSSVYVYNKPFDIMSSGGFSYHSFNNGVDFTFELERPFKSLQYGGKQYIEYDNYAEHIGGFNVGNGDISFVIENTNQKSIRFTLQNKYDISFLALFDYYDFDYVNNVPIIYTFQTVVAFKPSNTLIMGDYAQPLGILIPNGWSLTLLSIGGSGEFSSSVMAWDFINEESDGVYDYWLGWNDGYDDGYFEGYADGIDYETEGSMFAWVRALFSSMGAIFNVSLFGDFTIGTLALIMITFTLVPFIIGLFRGGSK